jgi:hypothetical protein
MIEASPGPARAGMIDGAAKPLVRVGRLDSAREGEETSGPSAKPDAFTDLGTDAARDPAFAPPGAAEHAATPSDRADDRGQRR